MRKNIIIYTENVHDPYTITVLNILKLMKANVFVLTYKNKIERIKRFFQEDKNIRFIPLKKTVLSKKKFITKFYCNRYNYRKVMEVVESNNIDTIFFLESYNKYLQRKYYNNPIFKKIKKILTVHNIHEYYNNGNKNNVTFFNFMDEYVVLSKKIINNLANLTNKNINVLPFKITYLHNIEKREEFLNRSNHQIIFTVPGVITSLRKNYYEVIDVFSQLSNYQLNFLGPLREPEIIKYANQKKVAVNYYNQYLSQDIFDEILTNSHFLLGIVSDKLPYGQLKASGVEYDGPSCGVPVIVNKKSVISDNGFYIYTENLGITLKQIFCDFENNEYLEKYGKPAFEKMKNNTADKYLENIKSLLEADK